MYLIPKNDRLIYLWLTASIWVITSAQIKQPNIVYIMSDDMGWFDVGFHNMSDIPTPNLDALAKNSVILNNYYVERQCSPSRSALLTGIYPSHTGLQHDVIRTAAPYGLPLNLKTLPERLKSLNYSTNMIGKWHLGFYETEYTPTSRGFDSFYGFWPGETDYFSYLTYSNINCSQSLNVPRLASCERLTYAGNSLRDGLKPVKDRQGDYLTHIFNEKALEIIKGHDKSKPMFLYLAHHAVHRGNGKLPIRGPNGTNEKFKYIKDENRRNFAGVLTALDDSVGDVIEALQESGMLNNTVIVFSTDNGAPVTGYRQNGGSNYPLRGQKFSAFEGGIKANGLIWYPNLVKPRVSNQLMHIVDWLPTLYKLAGGDSKKLQNIDGIDLWASISKEDLSLSKREVLLALDKTAGLGAIRQGDFKLINGTAGYENIDNWYETQGYEAIAVNNRAKLDESKVSRALKTLHDDRQDAVGNFNTIPITINCDMEEGSIPCEPMKAPCLFNITADPCERNNIAEKKPEILIQMLTRLNYYQRKEVNPLTKPNDFLSNPDWYGGYWSPWYTRGMEDTAPFKIYA